jgi:glutathione S-transferase
MPPSAHYRLFGEPLWISPYVFSSFVALREKGAAFSVEEVVLADGEHLAPKYRDTSFTARIPALEHGNFVLAESSAIAEYLEELLPPPTHTALLPARPEERARARQLMAWLRSDLGALRDERSTVTMFYRFHLDPLSPAGQRDAAKLIRVTEQLLPNTPGPLFGDWHLVDSELSFMLHRLILNGEPVPARVRAYADAEWQRPSVRAFAEHVRPAMVPDNYWSFSGTPKPKSK